MKAAVLHEFGGVPRYEDFADPVPSPEEILISVKAVALENIDRAMSDDTHFASRQFLSGLPAIVGFDGIGLDPEGNVVGFGGAKAPYGAMAEKTKVPRGYTVPIPEGVDPVIAAAMPASALTSLFPLKFGAKLQNGETVLINGATGVSGRLAVQIAKLLGAGRVVGTGRNPESLKKVLELGADAVIDLKQPDQELESAYKREAGSGYDVVLDFLWGHPTELLIRMLRPTQLGFGKPVRFVQIGEMAGKTVTLPADCLRTSGLTMMGGTAGLNGETIAQGTQEVWGYIRENKLRMEIEIVPLKEIESAWRRKDFAGKRLIVVP